jgi:hypothetical protein
MNAVTRKFWWSIEPANECEWLAVLLLDENFDWTRLVSATFDVSEHHAGEEHCC